MITGLAGDVNTARVAVQFEISLGSAFVLAA